MSKKKQPKKSARREHAIPLRGGLSDEIIHRPLIPAPSIDVGKLDDRSRRALVMLKGFVIEYLEKFERIQWVGSHEISNQVLLEHTRLESLNLDGLLDACLARRNGGSGYSLDPMLKQLAQRLRKDPRLQQHWLPIIGGSIHCIGSGHTMKSGSHRSSK